MHQLQQQLHHLRAQLPTAMLARHVQRCALGGAVVQVSAVLGQQFDGLQALLLTILQACRQCMGSAWAWASSS
jgi:hypothetical protein